MTRSPRSIILPAVRHRKGGCGMRSIGRLVRVAAAVCLGAFVAMLPHPAGAQPAPAAGQEDLETDVRVAQLLKDAQRKREAGQITEALADLRNANALIKKAKGAGHPDVLPVLDMAGTLLFENGQIAEAMTPLGKAVTMREEMIADGKKVPIVEMAAALVMLARAEMLAGMHAEAGERLTKAVGLFESSVGAGNESTLAALEQLAGVHFALGDADAGEAALGQVLERRLKLGAAGREGILRTATMLARARAWSGHAAAAIAPLAQAIADHERARLDKAAVPPALRQLAELQLEAGDADSGRQSIERALTVDRAILGDAHAAVIIDRLLLLKLDAATAGTEAIAAGCDPLVARLQQLAAQGDSRAAAGLRAAADVWMAAQEFGRASELFRQALELDKRLVGEDHPDVVADELGLGLCLLGNGDAGAALPLLDHARIVSKRIRGPRHAETQAVIAAVGECAARAGDLAVAQKHLQSLIDSGVPRRGDADEQQLCNLVEGVAALEERAGKRDPAMETRFSLVALRQRQFGEEHARVGDVMVRLANARQAAGSHADAVALYERAVAIMEAVHGADHPEVAAVLAPLAVSYRALGANAQAEAVLARGLAIWEATVGRDHPVTLATVKPLALVRLALKKDEEALPLMQRLLAAYDADPATPPADRLKLIKKLAQIHEARGDAEIARRYLERVVEAEAVLGKTAGMGGGDAAGDEVAVDTSKLKRLITVDEQAEANLAKARSVASSLEAAQERLARVDPRAAAKSGAKSAASAGANVAATADRATEQGPSTTPAADKPSSAPSAAAVIAAALDRHRAGQHDEAVGMLRAAIDAREKAGDVKGHSRAEVAELLIALADLRLQPLELSESVKLSSRALTTAAAAVGDGHPTTLTAAVRLAAMFRAKGDSAGAQQFDDLAAAKLAAAASKADRQQLESLREALRGAAMVALATGDRGATVRSLEMLLQTGNDLDDRSLLLALDIAREVMTSGADDPAVGAVRSRCLQLAKRAAGSRPVLSGIVQHHLALAEADAGKFPAAAALLEKAANVDRQTLGQTHPRAAYHLLELANVRGRQGDADGAESALAEVRDIESRTDLATAAMVADLRRLAALHADRREFETAAKLLAAALTAQEKSPERTSLAMAEIAEQSARLSVARGQPQRARDLFAEAATIAQAGHGGGHPLAVAAMLRRDRVGQRDSGTKSVAESGRRSADGAQAVSKASAASTSNFAALLAKREAEAAAVGRRQRADDRAMRSAAATGDRDDGAPASDQAAAPLSPEAEKARRALDAATRLYGGDPNKRKRPGAGRKGLEGIIAYTANIESMANDGAMAPQVDDGGTQVGEPPPRPSGSPRSNEPGTRPSSADPRPQPPVAGPRPSPFVAASRSGLRQRTALAKRRAAGTAVKAVSKVGDLMLAAWSAHERGSHAEAIAACEEALAQAGRESGESSRPVADVLDQFATIAIAQGDLVRGKQLLERLGSLRWKLLGPADPLVADAAGRLAGLLADCGEYERALPLAERAYVARMKNAAAAPVAAAEAVMLLGRIELGQGDPSAAAEQAVEARKFLAAAGQTGGEDVDGGGRLVARCNLLRLLVDLGNLQVASVEADRLVSDLSGGRPVSRAMAEEILLVAAQAHRLSGDAANAAVIAGRLVGMAQTTSEGAVFLSELALAQRAAADPRWEAAAIESGRVLMPFVRRLTPAATNARATAAMTQLAAAWLDSGRLDRADEAVAAASVAAASLPPMHPAALQAKVLAARLAAAKGDDAKASGILADMNAASGTRGVKPVAAARHRAFLAKATDPAAAQAALQHQADEERLKSQVAR